MGDIAIPSVCSVDLFSDLLRKANYDIDRAVDIFFGAAAEPPSGPIASASSSSLPRTAAVETSSSSSRAPVEVSPLRAPADSEQLKMIHVAEQFVAVLRGFDVLHKLVTWGRVLLK